LNRFFEVAVVFGRHFICSKDEKALWMRYMRIGSLYNDFHKIQIYLPGVTNEDLPLLPARFCSHCSLPAEYGAYFGGD
jgi:hypothetical protein